MRETYRRCFNVNACHLENILSHFAQLHLQPIRTNVSAQRSMQEVSRRNTQSMESKMCPIKSDTRPPLILPFHVSSYEISLQFPAFSCVFPQLTYEARSLYLDCALAGEPLHVGNKLVKGSRAGEKLLLPPHVQIQQAAQVPRLPRGRSAR